MNVVDREYNLFLDSLTGAQRVQISLDMLCEVAEFIAHQIEQEEPGLPRAARRCASHRFCI